MSKGNYSVGYCANYADRTVTIATLHTNPITDETVIEDETTLLIDPNMEMSEEEFNLTIESTINSGRMH
jgi:hypothetical protein